MNSVTTDQFRQLYLQAPLEGTAMNSTPNSQPQRGDKDAPTGRMARSLTQREDWTRDAVGVRRFGGDLFPSPDTAGHRNLWTTQVDGKHVA